MLRLISSLILNSNDLTRQTYHVVKRDENWACKIRMSYKEDTRIGHIQRERLPSDDRFTFDIVHVLRFGLTRNFAADLSLQIFNNH